jgi:hypothetical protein
MNGQSALKGIGEKEMAKKISFQEYQRRFNTAHPECDVEIRNYTAIIKPVEIYCKKCGKVHYYKNGNRAITGYSCCEKHDKRKIDKVKEWLDNNQDFDFVSQPDCEHVIVKHHVCGNTYKKDIGKFFSCPEACSYCNSRKNNLSSSLEHAQKLIDEIFLGQIKLLNYNGRHSRLHYRCLKCNQIFVSRFDGLLVSTGCPKCDRKQSLGEQKMKKMLIKNNLNFKEQVVLDGLPRLRFDFAIYDDNNNLLYLIEVQGTQHYTPVEFWGGEEGLKKQQERDQKKRDYCQKNNIPLYEIDYKDKKLLNLDILPFSSTTIPAKGSTA